MTTIGSLTCPQVVPDFTGLLTPAQRKALNDMAVAFEAASAQSSESFLEVLTAFAEATRTVDYGFPISLDRNGKPNT